MGSGTPWRSRGVCVAGVATAVHYRRGRAARRMNRKKAARPRGLEPLGHDGAAARTRTTRPRRCGREDSNARLRCSGDSNARLRAAAGTRTRDCALQRGLCRGTKACSAATLAARRSGADGDTKNRGGTALLSPWIDREAYREELGVVVQA